MTLTGTDDAILEPEKSGGGGKDASPGPSAQPGAAAEADGAEVQPEVQSASLPAPDADKPERKSASQARDADKPKRKSGEDGERRRGRGRSRSPPRRDHRNRDRGRDRDDRDHDRRDSRDSRGDRHHDDRRDRRHEDRRHEDRHRSSRRSRSPPRRSSPRRSRSPRRRERKPDREPAYDKEAVAAALARAQGAINGGLLPSVGSIGARPNLTAGVGTIGLSATQVRAARLPPPCARPAAVPRCTDPRTAPSVSQAGAPATRASASSALPAGAALPEGAPRADGKKGARDFSFLVKEDKQDSGPNLAMLGCSDSDSDSEGEGGGPAEGGEEDAFEAGSAIDQLLWRQKAVSGMETRRPGESVQQFFQRRMAGMRMLSAQAGTSSAKALENEVRAAWLFMKHRPRLATP